MTHNPDHDPDPHECPPCKIILDGRVLSGAAIRIAVLAFMKNRMELAGLAAAYAIQAHANVETFKTWMDRARDSSDEQVDEWHAWSELECHRAAVLRELAETDFESVRHDLADFNVENAIRDWTEESRLFATRMSGGEYRGAFIINGITDIRKKGDSPS